MARKTTYTLSSFSTAKVEAGGLMVMVRDDYTLPENMTISNINVKDGSGVDNPYFGGAGIACVGKGDKSKISLKVNGIVYFFNLEGKSFNSFVVDDATHYWKLWAATIGVSSDSAGNVISSSQNSITVRFEDDETGEITEETTTTYDTPSSVIINNLNARDQFAVQALRGMLPTLKNPLEVSDTVIDYYCTEAYRWANTMMSISASSRASLKDDTATQTTSVEEIGVLENDTDKLLNNLIAELERTDAAEFNSEATAYYKRVSIKNMSDILDKIQAQNVALTNITTQLNNIHTLLNNKLEAQNTALNLIAQNIAELASGTTQE